MNRIVRWCLGLVTKAKPLLIKIFPIEFLRKTKYRLVTKSKDGIQNADKRTHFVREANADGVNLIANIRGEIGLGQSARLLAGVLSHTKFPYTIFNYEQIAALRNSDHSFDEKISEETPYNINLIHVNPYEMGLMYLALPTDMWEKRYNIGYWLWELEEFPEEWLPALSLVDEIWVPADFIQISIKKVTNKPVYTIPYAITAPVDETVSRRFFGLPEDKFFYLSMYDSNSTMDRKNPLAAIAAYKEAFPTEKEDVGIVLKVNNPQEKDIALLKKELSGYQNVYFIKEILTKPQVNALISLVDVFVSLHRAEGFGLVLAEAMLLGTATVATNWSANTEFMNSDVACMVDYDLITIEEKSGPYEIGQRWADPSITHAAEFLLKYYEDNEFYQKIVTNAQTYIKEKLGMERAKKCAEKRVEEILGL